MSCRANNAILLPMKSTHEQDEEAREFWQSFLSGEGESLEAKAMGGWKCGPGKDDIAWGVLALTSQRFIYREMVSEKTLLGFRLASPRGPKKEREPVEYIVPRSAITGFEEGPRGILARLFGPPFPVFGLRWTEEGSGAERSESFSVDPTSEILVALRKLCPQPKA